MAQHTVGFIGFGNMAQAMAKGFLQAGVLEGAQIAACAKRWEKLEKTAGELGVIPCKDAVEVLERSDILILAVKPYLIETVLVPIREKLAGKVLLSVAAGWPFQRFEEALPAGVHHLSIMPNTPVAIGEGIVLLEEENSLSPQELSQTKELLAALGVVETVPSAQMGIAGTVAGCGPAYAALFLEALGDAGVYHGLPRDLSYRLAAQMLAGTGKLHLATGQHPGAMKDAVCSPGGTTIRGVAQLEQHGFRAAVIDAVSASVGEKKE